MPTYATAEQVRTELGFSSAELPDAEANRLLGYAEDRIDSLLGDRTVDEDTGRRIVVADEDSWRVEKLATATARLAARFHDEPELIHDRRFASESGEISASGPLGDVFGPAVTDPLTASGLLARPTSSIPIVRSDDRPHRGDPFLNL